MLARRPYPCRKGLSGKRVFFYYDRAAAWAKAMNLGEGGAARLGAITRSGPQARTGAVHTPGGAGRDAQPAQAQTLLIEQAHTGRHADRSQTSKPKRCVNMQIQPESHGAAAHAALGQPYAPLSQHQPDVLAYWSLHDIAREFDIFDVYDIPRPNSGDEELVSSWSSDCEDLSARSFPLSARLTPFLCWLRTDTKETLRADAGRRRGARCPTHLQSGPQGPCACPTHAHMIQLVLLFPSTSR